MSRARKSSDRRALAGRDDVVEEKWLVAFRNPNSRVRPEGTTFMRQFFAAGFYEAYDIVVSYAERSGLEVIWYKEKRLCEPYANRNIPTLESVCTYCNIKFNHHEPIPCADNACGAEFCSRECYLQHKAMKH